MTYEETVQYDREEIHAPNLAQFEYLVAWFRADKVPFAQYPDRLTIEPQPVTQRQSDIVARARSYMKEFYS